MRINFFKSALLSCGALAMVLQMASAAQAGFKPVSAAKPQPVRASSMKVQRAIQPAISNPKAQSVQIQLSQERVQPRMESSSQTDKLREQVQQLPRQDAIYQNATCGDYNLN